MRCTTGCRGSDANRDGQQGKLVCSGLSPGGLIREQYKSLIICGLIRGPPPALRATPASGGNVLPFAHCLLLIVHPASGEMFCRLSIAYCSLSTPPAGEMFCRLSIAHCPPPPAGDTSLRPCAFATSLALCASPSRAALSPAGGGGAQRRGWTAISNVNTDNCRT